MNYLPTASQQRGTRAFTLIELMIVVSIIALLVTIAVPNLIRARRNTRKRLCQNNLRLITNAVNEYQVQNNVNDGVSINLTADYDGDGFGDILGVGATSTAYIKQALTCPENNAPYPNVTTGQGAVCPNVGTYPEHTVS